MHIASTLSLAMICLLASTIGLSRAEDQGTGSARSETRDAAESNPIRLPLPAPAAGADSNDKQIVESYYCGCYDEPEAHYPYSLVVLKTAQGDLIARPEGTDGALFFTPLAIRYGNRYCEVGSEHCFGSFSHPCEFTDFRYGAALAQFFPNCKSP